MNRLFVAVGIIGLSLAISFIGYFTVKSNCGIIEDQLERVCILAREKKTDEARREAEISVSLWEKQHGKIEAFVPHSVTDNLEEMIKSLPIYAQQNNMERLEQQADMAIDEIHHLLRSEKPLLSNIF